MTVWKENGLGEGSFDLDEPQASNLRNWDSNILTLALLVRLNRMIHRKF